MKHLAPSAHQPAAAVASPQGRHVLILGGGASGVLMALHLLAQRGSSLRVTLVERRGALGQGIAYATHDPDHLLNTRVHNMSAFPDDPQHFHRWLTAQGQTATEQCFVSRATYGAYLAGLLAPWAHSARLTCVAAECLGLTETPQGVQAALSDGSLRPADLAVLATGHAAPAPGGPALSDPWQAPVLADPGQPVALVGSGLTMVDQVLSLLNRGHRGPIIALSRRGQLPRPHAETVPLKLGPAAVPLGAPLSTLLRWLRALARRTEADGGTWRDAVDGLRPHVRSLWCAMSTDQRARFLRHGATWWDVHRHRIPPASQARIAQALADGQLHLRRGAFLGADRVGDGVSLRFRPAGGTAEVLHVAAALDCRGIRRDPAHQASPLIAGLLAAGLARTDPLRIGLEVTQDCRLVGQDGQPSARIRAIGPVTRAAFWEITAIPDIREQTAGLAAALVAELATV